MSLADRDYHRNPQRGAGASQLTVMVKWLLTANILIYLTDCVVLPLLLGSERQPLPPILAWGAFSIESAIQHGRIWEFLTFQFLHAGFAHILLNSLGLYFFGPWLERHLGALKFLIYYLLCGCGGALFYTLISHLHVIPWAPQTPLVGASAGIYGIFAAIAVIAPNLRVQLLIPPVELSMRQLALVMLGIATAVIAFNLENAGGEAGHLGGAILGFLLMRLRFFIGDPSLAELTGAPRRRFWQPKLRPRTEIRLDEDSEVDRILDKVSREGFQSLSDEERQTLQKAANQR